jgi:hypothetical protein
LQEPVSTKAVENPVHGAWITVSSGRMNLALQRIAQMAGMWTISHLSLSATVRLLVEQHPPRGIASNAVDIGREIQRANGKPRLLQKLAPGRVLGSRFIAACGALQPPSITT